MRQRQDVEDVELDEAQPQEVEPWWKMAQKISRFTSTLWL